MKEYGFVCFEAFYQKINGDWVYEVFEEETLIEAKRYVNFKACRVGYVKAI
ncbi:hypothetical protein E5K34_001207 [Enterococcus faecalis]|nr:hypothetical protein [Enterococcus faecalis]